MAKRFSDTGLGREPWFRKLSPKMKCAFRFLVDECDVAGVWVIDMDAMSFYVGDKISEKELLEDINSDKINRVELFNSSKIFIPGFVEFQYGKLTENCKPHRPIIQKLEKYGLFERVSKGYRKGINTLEEKEQEQDVLINKEKGNDFPKNPTSENIDLALPEIKIGAIKELMSITKQQALSTDQVLGLWRVFKTQNFTGVKFYQNVSDVYSHFTNWMKTQKVEATKKPFSLFDGRKDLTKISNGN